MRDYSRPMDQPQRKPGLAWRKYECYEVRVLPGHGRRHRGTGVRSPQNNLRWGTAHASVPPIFGEVVLMETCVSTNREKPKLF